MTTQRLNPVAWTEGLFLRPQHLQQHELFNEERLRYHLRALNPFHWGVREFEVDEEALTDHKFVILRLDAVLPGGIIVRHPGNAVIESREFEASAKRIDVHIGIHDLSATEANAARGSDGVRDVRFLIDAHELPDVASGGGNVPVELAHPNVRVFLSGEESVLERHETIKIAEIEATGKVKEPFALRATYAPPLLAVQAHGPLFDELTQLVSRMAGSLRVVSGRTMTIAVGDLDKVYMRYTLARLTPVIRHLLSTGETRPFDLYTVLVETAGALSCFRHQAVAELPPYDHTDLYRCFHELIEFVNEGLEAEGYRFVELKLEFEREKKAYTTAALNTDLVDPRNHYYLAVKAEMDSQELRQLVVDVGKASSRSGVAFLDEFNVAGLRIEHLAAAPTEIAGPPGFEYFKLDPHGEQWKRIREEFTFALSLGKLESADARMYVVRPAEG